MVISAPAAAGDQVPFKALSRGTLKLRSFCPRALFTDTRSFSETRPIWEPSPGPENFTKTSATSKYYILWQLSLFAANGDELANTFEGYLTPTGTPGVFDNHENTDVTGGTGRFTGATGHWESGGQIDFTTEPISFFPPRKGGSQVSARRGTKTKDYAADCASQLAASISSSNSATLMPKRYVWRRSGNC